MARKLVLGLGGGFGHDKSILFESSGGLFLLISMVLMSIFTVTMILLACSDGAQNSIRKKDGGGANCGGAACGGGGCGGGGCGGGCGG
ncbi:hypothetical protein L6164_022443 [Bauhinia variegata]|uniref:Uncharacterized protein n=1 Tax=Bauhinia variegata TaxID=167791 RepID=A0ACB9MFN6_BAUVA|nr:hypothetical protein L6164_022443 [Bauhinia variegata]